jgi:PDZ domain-containing protein
VFASCTRQEILQIVRWGDEVTVDAGAVLWHEGTIGLHFVVVVAGELMLTRDGRCVARLGPGDYTGDEAILGWGPQHATLRATTACRLFVMGRAALLSLVHTPGVRAGVLGLADENAGRERLRVLREAGLAEWQQRGPVFVDATPLRAPSSFRFYPAAGPVRPATPQRTLRLPRPMASVAPMSRRARVALVAALAATVLIPAGVAATTARPLVGLVSPGKPIDIAADVTVEGAPPTVIHGRYILTAVRITRPNYARIIPARFRHQTTVPLSPDQRAAAEAGRAAFANAKRNATSAAESGLAWDPARLRVTMKPLAVSGASVGLIYALTVWDVLDPADLARGRTVAATGAIDADGRVTPVRFVDAKMRVARAAGATLFLVPPGQTPQHPSLRVVEVATLADAIAVLRA